MNKRINEAIEIPVKKIWNLNPNEDTAVRSRDPKRAEMNRALRVGGMTHSLTCQSEQVLASCL